MLKRKYNRQIMNYPLNCQCLTNNIVYKSNIQSDNENKFYIGLMETICKIDFITINKD